MYGRCMHERQWVTARMEPTVGNSWIGLLGGPSRPHCWLPGPLSPPPTHLRDEAEPRPQGPQRHSGDVGTIN